MGVGHHYRSRPATTHRRRWSTSTDARPVRGGHAICSAPAASGLMAAGADGPADRFRGGATTGLSRRSDRVPRHPSEESLKQLLQDEARRKERFAVAERLAETVDRRLTLSLAPAERQRPNACFGGPAPAPWPGAQTDGARRRRAAVVVAIRDPLRYRLIQFASSRLARNADTSVSVASLVSRAQCLAASRRPRTSEHIVVRPDYAGLCLGIHGEPPNVSRL